VRHLLDGVIHIAHDDGSSPWCHGAKGYLHPDLTNVRAMGLKGTVAVEGNRPVIAEADECILEHLWEPREVLAHGTKTPILAEGAMGVVIQVHL
jgi:hypothetical protein